MAFVPFPNTVSLVHRFVWVGKVVSYGLHLSRPGYTPANAQLLANIAAESWEDTLATVQGVGLVADTVTVQDLSETGAPNYVSLDAVGLTGDVINDGAPNNTALIVSHRTADTGRSARGRTYLPGMVEDQIVDGLVSDVAKAAFAVQWGLYIADLEIQGWTFVVAQRVEDGVPLTTGVTREVTDEVFPSKLGTQRLRQAS